MQEREQPEGLAETDGGGRHRELRTTAWLTLAALAGYCVLAGASVTSWALLAAIAACASLWLRLDRDPGDTEDQH